jgi:NADH-quinone oxidoreductase subunit G
MLADPRQGYLLWGLEPDRDLADPTLAMSALRAAKQVVVCSAFRSPALESVADVMLPISAFAETAGTFVNTEVRWQRFQGAVPPPGDARPGWKVMRVLGTMMELPGFAQNSAREVQEEVASQCQDLVPDNQLQGNMPVAVPSSATSQPAELFRLGNVPIYATDPLVRRAPALQRTPLAERFAVSLHPAEAARLGLADGQMARIIQIATNGEPVEAVAPAVIDDRIAVGCARIPAGVEGSGGLGPIMGPVQVSKAGA